MLLIRTIGHSTRPSEALIEMLKTQGISRLIDVRTIPRSRHNPQYNSEALAAALAAAGIAYEHRKELGGLRHPRKDSPNTAWRNDSFRGYADYMQTPEFTAALDALIALAGREPVAIMCAEAVPWRCHRSLIADALVVRGILVEHIMSAGKAEPHALTSFAHAEGAWVTYPAAQTALF
jgi:uncharacterized protein (DUF488 family)